MKLPFKNETPNYTTEAPETPYQLAKQEWDHRIGSARVEARNWRLMALGAIAIAILLLAILLVFLSTKKDRVFVAEVTQTGRVVNVVPLTTTYHPTEAQTEYFLGHFIELIRTVPLDPVVAQKNWWTAYKFLSEKGAAALVNFQREHNPQALLGKKTVSVKISNITPISSATYEINWLETTVNLNGQLDGQKTFTGVFTISFKTPASQEEILKNPLGIFIIDFHITPRETINENKP